MAQKSSSAIVNQRKLKIAEWLRDGLTRRDILRNAAEEKWGISPRAIEQYLTDIYEEWNTHLKTELPYIKAEAVEIRKKLYLRALKSGDNKTALAVRDSLDRIRGLFTDKIINLNAEAEKTFELTEEEEKRLARELGIIFKKKE